MLIRWPGSQRDLRAAKPCHERSRTIPCNRRTLLQSIGSPALAALASPVLRAQEQVARATRGMPAPRIKDISVIECAPAGTRLTVVKITTDQDGLYGYGCGTFTQRADLV